MMVDTEQECVRALAEVGSDTRGTALGAASGLPEVFAVLEALGAELMWRSR